MLFANIASGCGSAVTASLICGARFGQSESRASGDSRSGSVSRMSSPTMRASAHAASSRLCVVPVSPEKIDWD
jgi:hypothetical protein